jgi:hypothetical protein
MAIRRNKKRAFGVNEPIRHPDYHRPVTRRDFLAQGFIGGSATVIAPTVLGLIASPGKADAALSQDVNAMLEANECNIRGALGSKVPFICFDLAGGANIAGSNVLVGQQNGQTDLLTTAGYSKLGIPGDMAPTASNPGTFVNTTLGLAFHGGRAGRVPGVFNSGFDGSAFLDGIMTKVSTTTAAGINGVVVPARSENDTGNNPHNPMYGIARAGARGQLLTLIGSQNSDSGGNSMAPASLMNAEWRPTKIDRTSDATGLVDTGELGSMFGNIPDTVTVMESIQRMSAFKLNLNTVNTGLGAGDPAAKHLVRCGYVRTAYQVDEFGDPSNLNPRVDPRITGGTVNGQTYTPIFTVENGSLRSNGLQSGEYEKTAAVMKLVVDGKAGAGTISMGGFDYHDGTRATGELRDFRAGECIGACLEYAARRGTPLMIYVFSDGSLSSNGMIDNTGDGKGKGQWTGDNQSTAASFFLVYNPGAPPTVLAPGNQLGWFRANGDVEAMSSPAANSVNNLVELVVLNYLALHGEQDRISDPDMFPGSVFSNAVLRQRFTGFAELQSTPGGGGGGGGGGPTSCNTTDISLNHGHSFLLTPAQLVAGVPLLVTAGTDGHTHTVTLTAQDVLALSSGQSVSVMTSSDGMPAPQGHTHEIDLTCM